MNIPELFDLHQRVAIVTGAAMGIGAKIAERLAQAGASVALVDVDGNTARDVAGVIAGSGGKAASFTCDVSRVEQVRQTTEKVMEAFGRIDILVNNAGIFPFAPMLDVSESTWDKVLDINLKGAFFMAQAAARHMMASGRGGSIVNIASVDGLHPSGFLAHYDASKGGMIMMTRSLAQELAPKRIRVNVVAPGAIQTPGAQAAMSSMGATSSSTNASAQFLSRIPLGRMGSPEDIANAALFLVSPASDYVTGSTLVVDGGYLLS